MLITRHLSRHIRNQKGMAVLEMIPITIIIVLLLSFSFGFFGVIHTGILNSIGARNYAFETFNHRSDLKYFRSTTESSGAALREQYFGAWNFRIHAIASDKRKSSETRAEATAREIIFGWSFGQPDAAADQDQNYHNIELHSIRDDGTRYNAKAGANPVWIQSSYGICLNSKCEPN